MPVVREHARPLGVVYTPPEVAAAMVRLALQPWLADGSAEQLSALRICDFAVGEGVFLEAAIAEISKALAARGQPAAGFVGALAARSNVTASQPAASVADGPAVAHSDVAARPTAATCLAGTSDLAARQPAAVSPAGTASARGHVAAKRPVPSVDEPAGRGDVDARQLAAGCVAGVDIDRDVLAIARRRLGGPHDALRVGNALEIDWAAAFPEVFARGGFDIVVGNPPYIRQESLTGKRALEKFESFDGVADLYIYFIELAHRLLRPGGRYCLITPNKWLTVDYGRKLRGFLAARGSVDGIVDLGHLPLFRDADAFPCIVWGTVGRARGDSVQVTRATTDDVAVALRSTTALPRARLTGEPWHLDTPAERALLDRLDRWPRLGDLLSAKPARGVVTGCNRAFVIDRPTRDRLLDDPTSAPLIRPFVKGRDVRRWRAAAPERWILLVDRGTRIDEHPAIAAHLAAFRDALEPRPLDHAGSWHGRKPGSYRWFELQDPVGELAAARVPRLLYQDIQTAPACALDDGDCVPDTTVWMLPTADRVVLAILNSSLYGWYARRRFPPALNGAVRPKLAYISALPIATADPRQRAAIEALVDEQRIAPTPALDAELDRQVLALYDVTL